MKFRRGQKVIVHRWDGEYEAKVWSVNKTYQRRNKPVVGALLVQATETRFKTVRWVHPAQCLLVIPNSKEVRG